MSVKLDLKNYIINGAMDYWQRGLGPFTSVTNNQYTADRWAYSKDGTVVHTISRITDVPPTAFGRAAIRLSIPTTAQASFTGTQIIALAQRIEGTFLRQFKGKKMVLSFWVRSNVIGTAGLTLVNSTATRILPLQYDVSQSGVWERKVLRFEQDVTGTWNYDTNVGVNVFFFLAAGSGRHGTLGVWQNGAGSTLVTPNQTNFCANVNNYFDIADVCLVEDNEGQTRDPEFQLAGRDLAEELQLCQRYYEIWSGQRYYFTNYGNDTTAAFAQERTLNIQFFVKKRGTPAVSITAGPGTPTVTAINSDGFLSISGGQSTTATVAISIYTADAEL
jgi:hypothetical protein